MTVLFVIFEKALVRVCFGTGLSDPEAAHGNAEAPAPGPGDAGHSWSGYFWISKFISSSEHVFVVCVIDPPWFMGMLPQPGPVLL